MRVRRLTKNFAAGLMFILFGLFGLWLARDLDVGTAGDMGPGYFPRAICALLILLGAFLSATDLLQEPEPVEGWAWKPLLLVTAAALAFAFLLKPIGLVGAIVVATLLANAAGTLVHPARLALLTAILVLSNVGIFVYGLKMPIPLWPSVF